MLLTKHSLDILKFLSNKNFFLGASCTIIVRLTVTDAVCPLCFRMLEHGKTWCNCKDVSGLGISALGWTLLRSLYCYSNFCSQHHISRDVTNVAGQCEEKKRQGKRERTQRLHSTVTLLCKRFRGKDKGKHISSCFLKLQNMDILSFCELYCWTGLS